MDYTETERMLLMYKKKNIYLTALAISMAGLTLTGCGSATNEVTALDGGMADAEAADVAEQDDMALVVNSDDDKSEAETVSSEKVQATVDGELADNNSDDVELEEMSAVEIEKHANANNRVASNNTLDDKNKTVENNKTVVVKNTDQSVVAENTKSSVNKASKAPAGIPTSVPKSATVSGSNEKSGIRSSVAVASREKSETVSTNTSTESKPSVVQYESSVRYVEGKGWYGRNGQYLGKYRYGNGKGENFYSDSVEELDAMAEANRQEYLNSLTVSVELNRNVDAEINKIRVANGKNPTTNSDKLDEEALRRAAELYEQGKDDVNKISHEGSGYLENIQGNTCGGATDEQVVKNYDESLMHSAQQKSGSHATSSSATAYVKDADGNVLARYDVTVFGDDVDPADNPDFYIAPDVLEKERELGMVSDEEYEKFKAKNEELDESFANILFGDYSGGDNTSESAETETTTEE